MRALLDHLRGVVAVELEDRPGRVVRLVRLEIVVLGVDSSEELVSAGSQACDVDPLKCKCVSLAVAPADRDAHLHGLRGLAAHGIPGCCTNPRDALGKRLASTAKESVGVGVRAEASGPA